MNALIWLVVKVLLCQKEAYRVSSALNFMHWLFTFLGKYCSVHGKSCKVVLTFQTFQWMPSACAVYFTMFKEFSLYAGSNPISSRRLCTPLCTSWIRGSEILMYEHSNQATEQFYLALLFHAVHGVYDFSFCTWIKPNKSLSVINQMKQNMLHFQCDHALVQFCNLLNRTKFFWAQCVRSCNFDRHANIWGLY